MNYNHNEEVINHAKQTSFQEDNSLNGTVYFVKNQFVFKSGIIDYTGVAYGTFNDSLDTLGWGILKIETNTAFDDNTQMYAAGYLEGALTSDRIYDNYLNMYDYFFSGSGNAPTPALYNFLSENDAWIRAQIASNTSDYWTQISYIISQYDGLVAGYGAVATNSLQPFAFQLLNGVGDFLDLIPAVEMSMRVNYADLTKEQLNRVLGKNGHCSGLIKVNGDLSDLWAAHSSWFTYGAMVRIYKHYNFNLNAAFVSGRKMSFSSYPGFLVSLDDFYIMGNGIVMVQTTNSIINMNLYDLVQPKSVFAWQRVRLSNSMAKNGEEWGALFSLYNSGTYNNQYMVVDYNKFTPGNSLEKGTLYVVEQIPGLVIYEDETSQLERGYWASYNVPFFEEIYNQSGYNELTEMMMKSGETEDGLGSSYQLAPRAKIFRRDQDSVVDLDSLKAMMRYNDYKNDPYSDGDPGNAICSRFDLEPSNSSEAGPFGCIDTKVTSYALAQQMISHAINGPTTSHGLPPFEWTPAFNASTVHAGSPILYNFDFIEMNPQWGIFDEQ